MKLTPLEIRKMEFNRSLRGYNPEEVRAFLDTVADQVDAVQREANDFSDKIVRLETRLSDFQVMQSTLQDTLMKAEETSHRMRADSQREGEIIKREAELEAQRILAEAGTQLDHLRNEILMLQSRRDTFIRKLKYLLQSQSELIDILENTDFTADEGDNRETP
ncbi:MAG: DivIVA domain-containing protein [Candidatus Zixiibacteriota bacterium]|nr:MAG: DivIVA domain-containing protein [candidate division Zixibacteria bacterium]